MAYTYNAGLRIRPPEPMPDCLPGESPQDYFSRVLSQCSLESATSAENNSGDSAPTPFNIGQIQNDIARNTADITALETQVGELETEVTTVSGQVAAGFSSYAAGDTELFIGLPSIANWSVSVVPVGSDPLANLYITLTQNNFTVYFDAATSAGNISWVAIKR